MITTQPIPSGETLADEFARRLALLRGPEIQPADGTIVAADLRALGSALAAAYATQQRALAQAHPGTTTDLLPDLEAEYGLPDGSSLPLVARQARLLAKYRARNAGTRPKILVTAQTVAPEATITSIPLDLVAGTDPTAVFRFILTLSADDWNNPALVQQLDALLGQQVPAHVTWVDTPRVGFRCNDPLSTCDATVLAY